MWRPNQNRSNVVPLFDGVDDVLFDDAGHLEAHVHDVVEQHVDDLLSVRVELGLNLAQLIPHSFGLRMHLL